VAELLSDAGTREVPSSQELSVLVSRMRSVQGNSAQANAGMTKLAEALVVGFGEGGHRRQLRALHGIEALVLSQVHGAKEFFTARTAAIAALSDSSYPPLQSKALKVLALVVKSSSSSPSSSSAMACGAFGSQEFIATKKSTPLIDLLGGEAESKPASGGSLFSGLEPQETKTDAGLPAAAPLADLLGEPTAPSQPAKTGRTIDIFEGLEKKSAPASAGVSLLDDPQPQTSSSTASSAFPFATASETRKPAAGTPSHLDLITGSPEPVTTTAAFPFITASSDPQSTSSAFPFTSTTTTTLVPAKAATAPSAFPFVAEPAKKQPPPSQQQRQESGWDFVRSEVQDAARKK
jgi:hypothetical protein